VKNAHLRFGHLVYTKILKKTTTRFRLPLDRFIGESESDTVAKAHLISVIRGDTQIAALSAAVANSDSFTIEAPEHTPFHVTLGSNPESYRGSLQMRNLERIGGAGFDIRLNSRGVPVVLGVRIDRSHFNRSNIEIVSNAVKTPGMSAAGSGFSD
jgi:hypothetical protein